ncbi:MAG: YesL family protein [Lachnospiraceae bacterium]|nr:YesL family protein [Lachnospiraceae bacterium]
MRFLSNESLLERITGQIFNIVILNLLFLLCCIPVVTIGASFTAMYYALLRLVRYGDTSVIKDFFKGFRTNWKRSTIVWCISIIIAFICLADLNFFKTMGGSVGSIGYCVTAAIGICCLIILFYLFPVIATFENTLLNLIKHSVFFAISNIPNLLMISFANIFPMYLTYSDLKLLPLYAFIWCFFGFALIAYFNSRLLISQFNKFLPPVENPEENPAAELQ